MMYNETVESCFFAPHHVGSLDLAEPLTEHYRSGLPGKGDLFDLYLLCNEEGLVLKANFKAYGSPYLIAAVELICRRLEGSRVSEHPQLDHAWLVNTLDLPKIRYPVAIQVEDAYREILTKMKMKLRDK